MRNTIGYGRQGLRVALALAVMALAACASRPAPGYGGRWQAVNRYSELPQEIPLQQPYTFRPSPMDGTLKTMLDRWARDSGMTLSFEHSSDFTLHSALANIRTDDLRRALAQLTEAYAGQGLTVTIEGNRILVQRAPTDATVTAEP